MSIIIDRQDGLSSSTAVKGPCRVGTTANLPSLAGLLTIDGVTLQAGDRVLVKDQTSTADNGIYQADTGNWTRCKDFSRSDDVAKGTEVLVTSGAVNNSLRYYVSTAGQINIGLTGITFALVNSSVAQVAKVPNRTALKALSTAAFNNVIQQDSGFQWVWMTGDFSAEIAADIDENTYVKADDTAASAGAWVRVSPATPPVIASRTIYFTDYRARYGTDRAAFVAMLTDAFDTSDNAFAITVDLEGCTLSLTPIDVAAETGRTTNFKQVTITNGTFYADNTFGDFAPVVRSFNATIAQYSNTVTVTSTAGLEVGMCMTDISIGAIIMPDGMPRESYITGILSSTQFTISTNCYRDRTKFYNAVKWPYFLTFKGFTTFSRVRFTALNLRCQGVASGIQLAQSGNDIYFQQIHALNVADRLITEWWNNGSGAEFNNITAWSNDGTETHTNVGITVTDNDAKFISNRIINFRHSQVMHGGGYMILRCHNWQGGTTSYKRTAAYVHTNVRPYVTYTGNYIDNGGVEVSNENQSTSVAINDITISGNIFTMSDRATSTSRYITLSLAGYGAEPATTGIDGLSVTGNVFRRLLGSSMPGLIPTVETLETYGTKSLDNNAIFDLSFDDNTFRGITNGTYDPATITLTKAAADAAWAFDFSTDLPFGLEPRRVVGETQGGLLGMRDGASTLTYQGSMTQVSGGDPKTIVWKVATAVKGTVSITATVNS